ILKSEARDIIKKSEFLLQTVSEHHRTKGSFLFNFFQRAKQGGERMIRELDVIAHSGPSKLHKK
ncbi:MAG: hypothetical protein Q7K42_05675, partial [Candidatus Diapherotrites archaeon]|nr:hypothetical protein [Candidatus Diapherotrites archaeon]